MGLDMYLEKEIYVGANYAHRKVKGDINITVGENNDPIDVDLSKISTIRERAAYWRKANQIHAWFVKNVQSGEDDCRDYWVSTEHLEKLVDTCKKVIKDNSLAQKLLPTQNGFFFGSDEYGDYYFECLKDTVEQLENIDDGDYYYSSSW